jgi:hypothetical protein
MVEKLLLFSTFIFEYGHERGNDIAGNKNENELLVFRKRTNSTRIMADKNSIRNTGPRSITLKMCMTKLSA